MISQIAAIGISSNKLSGKHCQAKNAFWKGRTNIGMYRLFRDILKYFKL
jgi:hypothetical protein